MSSSTQRDILKQLLLACWGALTLVLIVLVVYLFQEVSMRGESMGRIAADVFASGATQPASPPRPAVETRPQEVTLYFGDSDQPLLRAEKRTIPLTDSTVENCRKVLAALLAGPEQSALVPIVRPEGRIRAIYLLEDGELVVDFSRAIIPPPGQYRSALAEGLFLQGITHTLCQPALTGKNDTTVTKVRVLIEGATPSENFPSHWDLRTALTPNPEWLASTG
jgi:spore germination protein GerM